MNAAQRLEEIRRRIETEFAPESVQIEDEGHLHVGHEGAKGGLGHFRVLIVSDMFQGKPLIKRHRLVYQAMGDLMQSDIHALTIEAFTPDEF